MGRGICMNIWNKDHMLKFSLSHVNVHQKASTPEEALNNQEGKITWPVDISPAFDISQLTEGIMAHEQNGHSGRGGSSSFEGDKYFLST